MSEEVLSSDVIWILTRRQATSVLGGDVPSVPGYAVTWKGSAAAIERLKGQMIRLRFFVGNYDLFSFRAS